VDSQREVSLERKVCEAVSSAAAATEFGSRGAAPPLGEATVMEVCGARML
jgi:hypothetical protein